MKLVISFLYQPIALLWKQQQKKGLQKIDTMNAQGHWNARRRIVTLLTAKASQTSIFCLLLGLGNKIT